MRFLLVTVLVVALVAPALCDSNSSTSSSSGSSSSSSNDSADDNNRFDERYEDLNQCYNEAVEDSNLRGRQIDDLSDVIREVMRMFENRRATADESDSDESTESVSELVCANYHANLIRRIIQGRAFTKLSLFWHRRDVRHVLVNVQDCLCADEESSEEPVTDASIEELTTFSPRTSSTVPPRTTESSPVERTSRAPVRGN